MSANFPALQVGERIEMGGSEWEVVRTTPAAAYVRERLTRAKLVSIVDRSGRERSFTATQGSAIVAISLHSAVTRIEARP